MTRTFILGTTIALTTAGAAMVFASDKPEAITSGYMVTQITADHRNAPIDLHVWYPTDDTGQGTMIGQNILFDGFMAQPDATPMTSPTPVVIFSHGSGGKAVQTGWLASQLAAQGMIVVAPNHQGTMSQDSDPFQTPMIWQRNRDMSAALDALEAGALGRFTPDMDRVAAMGFSFGGAIALSIAGAQLSKANFITYCAEQSQTFDCDWMKAAGVDFTTIDQTLYEANWRDPRISGVLAIDPALSHAMTSDSLAQIDLPMMTLGLGDAQTIPAAVNASHLGDKVAGAGHIWIPKAAHFSFLPSCGMIGKIAIGLMGDDNICSDWGLRNRDAVHADITTHTSAFLNDLFQTPS